MNEDFNFIELIMNASLPVKAVMLLLVLASITSWWMIFAKWMSLKSAEKKSKKFEDTFWSGVDLNKLYDSLIKNKKKSTGMEQIFESGFREFLRSRKASQSDIKATESADRGMRIALNKEIDGLERHLPFLATIGSISPYVGLLGTVIGIMISFQALSNVTQATIALVAPGISEALIATAMGLFAAIPAVVFYNNFNSKVERLYSSYDIFKEEFSTILHRQIGG
jgi:biopolymer transport protein TolQ